MASLWWTALLAALGYVVAVALIAAVLWILAERMRRRSERDR